MSKDIQKQRQLLITRLQGLDVLGNLTISKDKWYSIYGIHPSSMIWRWNTAKTNKDSRWQRKLGKKKFVVSSSDKYYFIHRTR